MPVEQIPLCSVCGAPLRPADVKRRNRKHRNCNSTMLPTAPLVKEIESWLRRQEVPSGEDIDTRLGILSPLQRLETYSGVSQRNIKRMRTGESKMVQLDTADRLCLALGLHLSLVYDEEQVAA